ncbi:MAG: type II toxin-antitoxin system PemK/MazF family toxin [Firmicutes bacterium]|nr:type II toxin-antitoxin system PemK/MazF family toxin [Bacillota bacterium]
MIKRPALVVSTEEHNKLRKDITLLKLSSQPVKDTKWEVLIKEWGTTGLNKPTKIVCDHIVVVPKHTVRFFGRLYPLTYNIVKRKLSLLLGI